MSNSLDISKNTARVCFGRSQPKFEKNSSNIDTSWFTQESNGRIPDSLRLKGSYSPICLKRELNQFFKILPKNGKSETER